MRTARYQPPLTTRRDLPASHLNIIGPSRVVQAGIAPLHHRAFTCTPASTPSSAPHSSNSYAPLQQPQPHSWDRSPYCSRRASAAVRQQCASVSTLRSRSSRSRPQEPRLWLLARAQSPASARGRRSRLWTACRRGCPLLGALGRRWIGLRV